MGADAGPATPAARGVLVSDLQCACGNESTLLCDYALRLAPVVKLGVGAPPPTCSAPLCETCATRVGSAFSCWSEGCEVDSVDLCPVHAPPVELRVLDGWHA